jgi:hypothetical protein
LSFLQISPANFAEIKIINFYQRAGAEQPFPTCQFILIDLFPFTITEVKNLHFKTNQLAGREGLLCARSLVKIYYFNFCKVGGRNL